MINEENLSKMYNGILSEHELTTKELNGYGFNSKDLTNLIESGMLERIKRGYYSFKSIDYLIVVTELSKNENGMFDFINGKVY